MFNWLVTKITCRRSPSIHILTISYPLFINYVPSQISYIISPTICLFHNFPFPSSSELGDDTGALVKDKHGNISLAPLFGFEGVKLNILHFHFNLSSLFIRILNTTHIMYVCVIADIVKMPQCLRRL